MNWLTKPQISIKVKEFIENNNLIVGIQEYSSYEFSYPALLIMDPVVQLYVTLIVMKHKQQAKSQKIHASNWINNNYTSRHNINHCFNWKDSRTFSPQ